MLMRSPLSLSLPRKPLPVIPTRLRNPGLREILHHQRFHNSYFVRLRNRPVLAFKLDEGHGGLDVGAGGEGGDDVEVGVGRLAGFEVGWKG